MIDFKLFRPWFGERRQIMFIIGLTLTQLLLMWGQLFLLVKGATELYYIGKPTAGIGLWFASFIVVSFLRFGVREWRSWQAQMTADKATAKLHSQLIAHTCLVNTDQIKAFGEGPLAMMFTHGLEHISEAMSNQFPRLLDLATVPFLLIVMLANDWLSALIATITYPIIIVFMRLFGITAKAKANREYALFQAMTLHFTDSLKGIATLRSFGCSTSHAEAVDAVAQSHRRLSLKTIMIATTSTFALDFMTTLSIAMVSLGLGLRLLEGKMLLEVALFVLVLLPEVFLPLRRFASGYHANLAGNTALAECQQWLGQETVPVLRQLVPSAVEGAGVSLQHITLANPSGMILENVNLTLRPNTLNLCFGKSGSGKTTLINFLAGEITHRADKASEIHLGDASVSTLRDKVWIESVIVLRQQTNIFDASFAENLSLFDPNASRAEMDKAVAQVGLSSLLQELPDGYATKLGATGRKLSAGEAKRLSLARILLAPKCKVVLLDEPTEHLDMITENELIPVIKSLTKGRIVVMASHRKFWQNIADSVIEIRDKTVSQHHLNGEDKTHVL